MIGFDLIEDEGKKVQQRKEVAQSWDCNCTDVGQLEEEVAAFAALAATNTAIAATEAASEAAFAQGHAFQKAVLLESTSKKISFDGHRNHNNAEVYRKEEPFDSQTKPNGKVG